MSLKAKDGWVFDENEEARFQFYGSLFTETDICKMLDVLWKFGGTEGAGWQMKETSDYFDILTEMGRTFRKHGFTEGELELT